MDEYLKQCMDELQKVEEITDYDRCVGGLKRVWIEEKYDLAIYQNIVGRAKYHTNSFSDEASRAAMKRSRDKLLEYLQGLLLAPAEKLPESVANLYMYLKNFYAFLEAFKEIKPHKRASLVAEDLQKITIINEYDLQHILYAVLKPLWQDARTEGVGDTGYSSVRADIVIDSIQAAIETKCTRKTLSVKELTEQIAADMFHYKQKYLFIYIYDREKVIENKEGFERAYSKITEEKHIYTIVLQSVYL